MFCPTCGTLTDAARCPACGSRELRPPREGDFCLLTEKAILWAGMLSDVLTQNDIPFTTKNLLGAGLTAKIGLGGERTRFYVPYGHYQAARDLEQSLFSDEAAAEEAPE